MLLLSLGQRKSLHGLKLAISMTQFSITKFVFVQVSNKFDFLSHYSNFELYKHDPVKKIFNDTPIERSGSVTT